MRVESAVTSVSWIPSEAVAGLAKMGFAAGAVRYDDPPPDRITDLAALHAAERFRFANHLAAWAEVRDGNVVGAGYTGRGYISSTRVYLGGRAGITFQPAEFPELRADPEVRGGEAVFVQTAGGRTGMPYPRPVRGRPFAQWTAPTVWDHAAADHQGRRVLGQRAGQRQPVPEALDLRPAGTAGGQVRPRRLRGLGAHRLRPSRVSRARSCTCCSTGVLAVLVNGQELGQLGPGAIAGERALLEDGVRTATLRAVTDCVVAVAGRDQVDRDRLAELAAPRHREDIPDH